MIFRLLCVIVIVSGISAAAFDGSCIGINATTNTFSLNNSYYGEKGLRNTTMVGARVFLMPNFAIDGAIGFGLNSSVPADTATMTANDPGIKNVSGQLGIFWKLTPASWQSYLGLVVSSGLGYQTWYDAVQLKDTTRTLPAPPKNDYVSYTLVEPYSVVVPFMSIGVEPGYSFDKHFSLFATIGVNGIFYPNSKAIDQRSVSANNTYITSLPLIERKDASFEMSVSSVGLGVRYLF
jgi:hypothetical protein